MRKVIGRQILIAEDAPVVQNAVYTLLEGAESSHNVSPSTRERLKAIADEGGNRLVLDLQVVEQPYEGTTPRVKNIHFDNLGKVAVVTCEVATQHMVHQVEELCRPHFFPNHVMFSLTAFAHAVLALF